MSTYEISKSSLLSLKAEILRKQEEIQQAKSENDVKIKAAIKKNTPLEIKNKGIEKRLLNDLTEEDKDLLKQSRLSLEAKAKLYDKLLNSKEKLTDEETEFNKRYLVQFDKKKGKISDLPPSDDEDDVDKYPDSDDNDFSSDYPAANPDEEWVEYVDCLGRTRKCLRKDLPYLKANDADLKEVVAEKNRKNNIDTPKPSQSPEPEEKDTNESELMSSDMRRERLREQWEKEEEELRKKDNIHYQDILFDEARTHGVGYYGFSKDEEERRKQQDALKKLREETEQQQKKAQTLKEMREKQLALRIKAARNRKRARLGLPPEEEETGSTEPSQPVEDEETRKAKEEEAERLKELEERERKLEESRRKHIRPWDLGKEGVKKPHYEYSQEEWVDKKRKERPEEFAPPSTYKKDTREKRKSSKRRNSDEYNGSKEESTPIEDELEDRLMSDYKKISKEDRRERSRGAEIAPPPTFDYYGPSSSKRTRDRSNLNIEESIEAGLQFIRNQFEKKANSRELSEEDIF